MSTLISEKTQNLCPVRLLESALAKIGPWYGPGGAENYCAWGVLFDTQQRLLAQQGNVRSAEYLKNRRGGSSVAWVMR